MEIWDQESAVSYMLKRLGNVALTLEFDADSDALHLAAADALIWYGARDFDAVLAEGDDGAIKIRVLLDYAAWKAAIANASAFYDFEADRGQYNRAQMVRFIRQMYNEAQSAATPYLSENTVFIYESLRRP